MSKESRGRASGPPLRRIVMSPALRSRGVSRGGGFFFLLAADSTFARHGNASKKNEKQHRRLPIPHTQCTPRRIGGGPGRAEGVGDGGGVCLSGGLTVFFSFRTSIPFLLVSLLLLSPPLSLSWSFSSSCPAARGTTVTPRWLPQPRRHQRAGGSGGINWGLSIRMNPVTLLTDGDSDRDRSMAIPSQRAMGGCGREGACGWDERPRV